MLFKKKLDGRKNGRRRRTVSDHSSSPEAVGSGAKKLNVAFGNKEHVKERK